MFSVLTLQALSVLAVFVLAQGMQPRSVVTVESHPARKVFGSVSAPEGSEWCQGRPMYWLVGHQSDSESPYCLTDHGWVRNLLVVLDSKDPLNAIDGPNNIDRHDCTAVDVNGDGVRDLVCGVGADKGKGTGFNEVYITQENGTLKKVPNGHGLHRYPTLRVRLVVSLSDPSGNLLVFLATNGIRRSDGATNSHKLFRRVLNETQPGEPSTFFFEDAAEEPSPLTEYTDASVIVVADFNGDGIDDLLVGNRKVAALLFIQEPDGLWKKVPLDGWRTEDWRCAKVADLSGDGINDLIVSDWGGRSSRNLNSTIMIFRGTREPPYFDFSSDGVLFEITMPYATPDIAVLDVNHDGKADLYITQVDQATRGTYCAEGNFNTRKFWGRGVNPSASFVPPLDEAHDFLFLGQSSDEPSFEIVTMEHAEPGCGFMVERFQNKTLLLAQGTRDRPGHNLLLEW
jgi:FG-GAP-like repeat